MIARRAVLSGRVQGVGFRFFAERAARESGVKGWVRNLADGRVETVAEGEERNVQSYLDRIRRGPLGSRVAEVEIGELEPVHYGSFEVTR